MTRRTLYLLYMNGDFKTMPPEDIKKQLDFCGLSEEELKKIRNVDASFMSYG